MPAAAPGVISAIGELPQIAIDDADRPAPDFLFSQAEIEPSAHFVFPQRPLYFLLRIRQTVIKDSSNYVHPPTPSSNSHF